MAEYTEGALFERMKQQETILKLMEEQCLTRIQQQHTQEGESCEMVWDRILCWDQATPNSVVRAMCPSYVVGFNEQAEASRYCTPEGTWFVSPMTNKSWSNYSMCVTQPYAFINIDPVNNTSVQHRWLPMVKGVSQAGYGVSLLTLLLALLVLSFSKKLRCPRNTLHMHLFVSFILRAFMALLKDTLFVQGVGLPSDVAEIEGQLRFLPEKNRNWACKSVTSVWQFCIMANYSWILMEGLYLHNLIFLALFTDSSAITLYVILGWGLPVLVVVPWIVLRAYLEDTYCWTTHQNRSLALVTRIPIAVSVLLNFILFVNIVRVLMLKLTSSLYVARSNARYGRWARSTLVLVPLFGVHYSLFLVMSYSLGNNATLELLWIFFDQLFASFQGFFVSLLYCLLNGEVRAELLTRWRALRLCAHGANAPANLRGSRGSLPDLPQQRTCQQFLDSNVLADRQSIDELIELNYCNGEAECKTPSQHAAHHI